MSRAEEFVEQLLNYKICKGIVVHWTINLTRYQPRKDQYPHFDDRSNPHNLEAKYYSRNLLSEARNAESCKTFPPITGLSHVHIYSINNTRPITERKYSSKHSRDLEHRSAKTTLQTPKNHMTNSGRQFTELPDSTICSQLSLRVVAKCNKGTAFYFRITEQQSNRIQIKQYRTRIIVQFVYEYSANNI